MNKIGRSMILAILTLFMASIFYPHDAVSGKGRRGRKGHRISARQGVSHPSARHKRTHTRDKRGSKHRRAKKGHTQKKHHKVSKHNHHHYKSRHYRYRHRHHPYRYGHAYHPYRSHFGFSFLIYPRYAHRGYYGYARQYPYRSEESTLIYKEEPEQFGLLELDIQPAETEIFLNGEFLGKAQELRERAPSFEMGEHQLELRLGPYSRFYRIQISPGAATNFSGDMSIGERYVEDFSSPYEKTEAVYACSSNANQGLLRLSVHPTEADVFLNDGFLGKAAGLAEAGIVLPEGTHQIRVETAEHEPYETSIHVSCGTPQELKVEMLRAG